MWWSIIHGPLDRRTDATKFTASKLAAVVVLSQSCFFEGFGVCKSLNLREPFSDFPPKIEICDRTRATPRRAGSCLGVRVVPRIPPAEFFHPPCGLDRLLPASPPRMTRGADGDAERRDRRACGIDGATRAHNRGLTIRGMHSSLHGLLLWRCYGAGCPVRHALWADRDVLSDCLRRRIERTWPSAGDADVRPRRDEALGGGRLMPLVPPVMRTTVPANVRLMSSATLSPSH
jgi:hypothetical protein